MIERDDALGIDPGRRERLAQLRHRGRDIDRVALAQECRRDTVAGTVPADAELVGNRAELGGTDDELTSRRGRRAELHILALVEAGEQVSER